MKTESNLKPPKIEIENIQNDRCEAVLCDNIQEVIDGDTTKYIFDLYRLNVCYNGDIEAEITNNFEKYLQYAKSKEFKALADEVRNKRNKLLEETDKEMCVDRLNIEFPENLSATNLLKGVKQFFETFSNIRKGKMAKYRQQLRDITKQEGFPYDVKFPEKPTNEKEGI